MTSLQDQIKEPEGAVGNHQAIMDNGTQEIGQGKGLLDAMQGNVEAADALALRVTEAKKLAGASLASTRDKFKQEAVQLREKLEKMHREQMEKLNADNALRNQWIDQFVEGLQADGQQEELTELDKLVEDIGEFKEKQQVMQEQVLEQIKLEAIQNEESAEENIQGDQQIEEVSEPVVQI